MSDAFIHPLADVGHCQIGPGTRIWQFVVVLADAVIGANCNICSHVFIEGGAVLGDRVTVKNGAKIWNGVTIQNDVFIGPNVCFTNDRHPKSRNAQFTLERTVVEQGASIGAGVVILPGCRIGAGATVGAGAVVTGDIAPGSVCWGNPARIHQGIQE